MTLFGVAYDRSPKPRGMSEDNYVHKISFVLIKLNLSHYTPRRRFGGEEV
jgi:hypothetical protein